MKITIYYYMKHLYQKFGNRQKKKLMCYIHPFVRNEVIFRDTLSHLCLIAKAIKIYTVINKKNKVYTIMSKTFIA